MTLAELQAQMEGAQCLIVFLGFGRPYGSTAKPWACTIEPKPSAIPWGSPSKARCDDLKVRGQGTSLEAAVEDALTKIAVLLLNKDKADG